jgi:hypothetical protein
MASTSTKYEGAVYYRQARIHTNDKCDMEVV